MSASIRSSSLVQRMWLTATTRVRVCQQCQRFLSPRQHPSAHFSAFAYLSRKSNTTTTPKPPSNKPPQSTPPPHTSSGATTVVPDSSSPYMQEDTTLERIALVGYGPDHFIVFNPSSLPNSSHSTASPPPSAVGGAAAEGGSEGGAVSLPVTASLVSSVTESSGRSGVLSRGVFSAPNTVTMWGGVIALPTAAFLWAPKDWSEVTVDSLAILDLMQEKPDLILFGTGHHIRPLSPSVSAYLQRLGVGYEVIQSSRAVGTFNMLVEEQRHVMAALVPYGEPAKEEEAEVEREAELPSAALRRRIEKQLGGQ